MQVRHTSIILQGMKYRMPGRKLYQRLNAKGRKACGNVAASMVRSTESQSLAMASLAAHMIDR